MPGSTSFRSTSSTRRKGLSKPSGVVSASTAVTSTQITPLATGSGSQSRHSSIVRGSSVVGSSRATGSTSGMRSGNSEAPSSTRYIKANEYVNTNPTPLGRNVANVPMSTMTATCLAGVAYVTCIMIILVSGCPFSRSVSFFFVYLILCLIALASMAGLNMLFPHYRFNCTSLSVSLFYSGTSFLIISSLIDSAFYGLCWQNGSSEVSPLSRPTDEPITSTTISQLSSRTTLGGNITSSIGVSTTSKGDLSTKKGRFFFDQDFEEVLVATDCLAPRILKAGVGVFSSGSVSNYFLWFIAAIGVAFQIVAHYFYG